MIAGFLETPVLVLLVGVMGFNLSQRQHIEHGEQKRFASLYLAGILLLFHIFLILIQHFFSSPLGDWLLIPSILLTAGLAFLFRHRIFLFRRTCESCGSQLPLSAVLYYDDNLCGSCRGNNQVRQNGSAELAQPGIQKQDSSEADLLAAADPLINPPEKNLLTEVPRNVDSFDWEAWEPSETAVICYVFENDQVLLIHKKRGLGRGKVNAPGGRIEPGETPRETAVRELQEEVGITPIEPREVGRLSFVFTNGYSLKGHVFFARKYEGEMIETDEADPFWVPVSEIPYDKMWEDDKLWLPITLKGALVDARFIFEDDTMLSHQITEIDRF